jgi:hypothetical protein
MSFAVSKLPELPLGPPQVLIEIAIGAGAQLIAEIQQRGPNFRAEMDFVVAGLLTCVLANFFAVYLSAPTIIPKAAVRATQQSSCSHSAQSLPFARILCSIHSKLRIFLV